MSSEPVHHTDPVVVDTERLGERVRRRRERELGLTRDQIRERGGPSTATQRNIETNQKPGHAYETPVLVKLARALGWTDDSLERIARGDEPVERPTEITVVDDEAETFDGWDIVAKVRPDRKLSAAEAEVVRADMLAAARRALLELDRHA